jgi:hypothetical protein
MEDIMTIAENIYNKLTNCLSDGYSVGVATAYKHYVITPKIAKEWQDAGKELFKIGNDGCLYMGNGKSYHCIAYEEMPLANFMYSKEWIDCLSMKRVSDKPYWER